MRKNNKQSYNIKDKIIMILCFSIFLLILFLFQLVLIKHDNEKNKKTYNYYLNKEKVSDTLIIDRYPNSSKDFQIKDGKLIER